MLSERKSNKNNLKKCSFNWAKVLTVILSFNELQ